MVFYINVVTFLNNMTKSVYLKHKFASTVIPTHGFIQMPIIETNYCYLLQPSFFCNEIYDMGEQNLDGQSLATL